ncbi:MAG: SUMF1/EgtB/PvdO family nonheme iron enzyme [Anaerolineaceae bacterium]
MLGLRRAERGGSWNNNEKNLRTANRNNNDNDNSNNNIGFRCAQSPKPWSEFMKIQTVFISVPQKASAERPCLTVLSGKYQKARLTGNLFVPGNFTTTIEYRVQ